MTASSLTVTVAYCRLQHSCVRHCRHRPAGPSMSCLRHVSKRSKGNVADDFGVVKDSVQLVPTVPLVSVPLADPTAEVWSVSDFSILHELQKPVVVVSAGTYELSHR